jgi:hypothetical protein
MTHSNAMSPQPCCPVLELRQYTLHPGKRDILIDLFDREFVESQEALGIRVIGQFRDLDRPDFFVWLRGFEDMPLRAKALAAFYGGPVWQAHRDAANATMIDSDNVLLLRPLDAASGFAMRDTARPPVDANKLPPGVIIATIYYLQASAERRLSAFFFDAIAPLIAEAGGRLLALLVTEPAPNTFPRLPVREGEQVFVWIADFADAQAQRKFQAALDARPALVAALQEVIEREEVLRLTPTARSLLPPPRSR